MGWFRNLKNFRKLNDKEPRPKIYFCNQNSCLHSFRGLSAEQLVYGCRGCQKRKSYSELSDDLKDRLSGFQLPNVLWKSDVLCKEHHNPIKPQCPECKLVLD